MTEASPQPLTPKEKGVLEFLEVYIGRHGLSPSFQEIKDHFGFASFNSVQRYLKQLEKKQYIHVPGGNKKRAISILNPSSAFQESVVSMSDHLPPQTFNPTNRSAFPSGRASGSPTREAPSASFEEPLSLPLLGKVAAGLPIEALEDNDDSHRVHVSLS